MQPTREEIDRAYYITFVVAEVIKGMGSVPSGYLYARLIDVMSLEVYQGVIRVLKEGGIIREVGDELIWVGVPIVVPEGPVS